MKNVLKPLLFGMVATVCALTSYAEEDDFPFSDQINARQASMTIYRYNLGLLGAMAKGDMPYDAKVAGEAAHNLTSVANMRNSTMWPAGSDVDAPGLADKTAAKASIWSNFPKVGEHHKALSEALATMSAVAGNGLDQVRANIGAVGKACKGCHEDFRVSDDH